MRCLFVRNKRRESCLLGSRGDGELLKTMHWIYNRISLAPSSTIGNTKEMQALSQQTKHTVEATTGFWGFSTIHLTPKVMK